MVTLVDGYNVIGAQNELCAPLADARERLIERVENLSLIHI